MNPIKEAAIAIHEAEQAHPRIKLRMDVSHKAVHITADLDEWQLARSVTWTEIEAGNFNILTATVALVVNQMAAQAAVQQPT